MAMTRHQLEQDIFQPSEERLVSMVHVSKVLKKKKPSFLCITVTTEKPPKVVITQVKKTDKNIYKKKNSWELSALKLVDAKSPTGSQENQEFDLQFDKLYRWTATNLNERQNFLIFLWRLSNKHLLKQKPVFRNYPEEWQSDEIQLPEPESVATAGASDTVEDYQPLTEKEESDLEKLMSQCDFAVSNAEAFMDLLARDLSILDGENIHSVLAAEQQVESLMAQLEKAVTEADQIETRLNHYCEALQHIQHSMEKMGEKNTLIQIAGKNNMKLQQELEHIVSQLDVPHHHHLALIEADLTSPEGLQNAIEAGNVLMAAMNADLHPSIVQLTAVQDQRRRCEKWRNKFSQSICRHLNNLFIHLGNRECSVEGIGHAATNLTVPRMDSIHADLRPYAPLMHWLRLMDRKDFTALSKVYTGSLSKLYDSVIRQFFEEARSRLASSSLKRGKGSSQDVSSSGTTPSGGQASPAAPRLLAHDREQWKASDTADSADRRKFDELLERALAQLEPMCLTEQKFCVHFFQLDVISPTNKNTQTTLDGLSSPSQPASSATTPNREEAGAPQQRRIERVINEEVRRMMGELFGTLEPELLAFIEYYEKIDSFCCMNVLVRLGQHVMSAQDTGSFLSVTFATLLVQVKRSFDRFMMAHKKSIDEMRANKGSKCGILPFVYNFEDFAKTAEGIFRNSERRADLEKWYRTLMAAMFEAIPRIASEHTKTPQQVIKMENFHHLHALLSQLKISVLDTQRKEAKQKYLDALKAYVTQYFGRPLEKLNLFFEGVQAKVAQGVKESEVSYQMAFSKQELRKVIREYPAREVKKGLDSLYKKVEKHLCEEENLLQVVWRAMQEEFIQQYKTIEELIQRCYPGAKIALDFTIGDILEFFSEIAQSH